MQLRKLYPGAKKKAFNISYDDGVWQDVAFVHMLNRYGLKGTFNLNSQLMYDGFQWQHESGLPVKRLPPERALKLYEGHEVASHTLTHPYMQGLSEGEIMHQLGHDKWQLSQLFGREIAGFALPFDWYSDEIADCARRCGFEYARMSQQRLCYTPPEDEYYWAAGIYHINPALMDFADGFFRTDEELALLQIVGHSYDLDAENLWAPIEDILRCVASDENVASMTNVELVRYLRAMKRVEIGENHIFNPTDTELWFEAEGKVFSLKAGEKLFINLIK